MTRRKRAQQALAFPTGSSTDAPPSTLCPHGGHYVYQQNGSSPYSAARVTSKFYKRCDSRGDYERWSWQAEDPSCRPSPTEDGWCRALGNRSILFIGDSVSVQMFWSFVFTVPISPSELRRVLDVSGDDFRRSGKDFTLCNGAARVNMLRNDWLVDPSWDSKCRYKPAKDLFCRAFVKRAQSYDTLVLNTGLHVARERTVVIERTRRLVSWLQTTSHNVVYRTSPPGHVDCERHVAPLNFEGAKGQRYQAPVHHRFGWDTIEPSETVRIHELDRGLPPARLRYVDAAGISNVRADRHMLDGRFGGGNIDCLHYCLPGPPDDWNRVLKGHFEEDLRRGPEGLKRRKGGLKPALRAVATYRQLGSGAQW
jgi:hypothetical protein